MSKQLKSNTTLNTLDMVKELNNLLDVLNSKSLFDKNPFKCAITQERPQQSVFLLKTKSWLENLKKYPNIGKTRDLRVLMDFCGR